MADRQLSWRCGSHHLVIGNLAADQTVRKVTGILTNLRRMFIILVNGIILRQDKAGGGRTAHGGSEDVCAVREMTYVINTMFYTFVHLKIVISSNDFSAFCVFL